MLRPRQEPAMNARDPLLPLQPDEATAIAAFAAKAWDEQIVPALTDYIAIPAKSPMFDALYALALTEMRENSVASIVPSCSEVGNPCRIRSATRKSLYLNDGPKSPWASVKRIRLI